MNRITGSIWKSLYKALDVRALYLIDICKQLGLPLQGQRYLDIGVGSLVNSLVFGKDFTTIHCIDLKVPKKDISSHANLVFTLGNAQALSFRDATFDLVSLFSVVEHVENQEQAICEALRVLKPGGALIVQIPNRRFPIELHSGLPNPLLCPKVIRRPLLRKLGYSRLEDIEIPSRKKMLRLFHNAHAPSLINEAKIIWPTVLVPNVLRGPYTVLARLGIFHFLPLGYIFIFKKLHPQEVRK